VSPRQARAPLTEDEARAKAERRYRSVQVSTFCLHAMAWILATFYATDYLPALFVRLVVGLNQATVLQFLAGYLILGVICALLAISFGCFYGPRIRQSRYSWRWYFFPVVLALVLIPAQGSNELLTRAIEAVCLVPGIVLGVGVSQPWRRWRRRPARGRVAAP
jgi:MFS family permease